MRTLVIEKSAVKNNISVIKEAVGHASIYANLSANAYGAGAVEIAGLLRDEGVSRFTVDDPATAVALRQAGLVEEEILMLGSPGEKKELETLLDHNVVFTVGSLEAGMALNALAAERATVVEAHVQVDCGMGFGGFPSEEPEKIFSLYDSLQNVAISGLYTHVRKRKGSFEQLLRFAKIIDDLHEKGYETGTIHAAGSYGLLHNKLTLLDAVRAGSALLGRCLREPGDGLETVGYGEVPIDTLRWLPKGHTVGGEKCIALRRPTRVAVIPLGYQYGFGVLTPVNSLPDALRRFFHNRRRTVRVNGQKARVLGPIGARETLLDVTSLKCSAGDLVTFEIEPMFAKGFQREYR